jgi:hypothetical protein
VKFLVSLTFGDDTVRNVLVDTTSQYARDGRQGAVAAAIEALTSGEVANHVRLQRVEIHMVHYEAEASNAEG